MLDLLFQLKPVCRQPQVKIKKSMTEGFPASPTHPISISAPINSLAAVGYKKQFSSRANNAHVSSSRSVPGMDRTFPLLLPVGPLRPRCSGCSWCTPRRAPARPGSGACGGPPGVRRRCGPFVQALGGGARCPNVLVINRFTSRDSLEFRGLRFLRWG